MEKTRQYSAVMMARQLTYLGVVLVAVLAGVWTYVSSDTPQVSSPVWDETRSFAVPSRQSIRLSDVIQQDDAGEGRTVWYRFLAPSIARLGGTIDFAQAETDMIALCNDHILPKIMSDGDLMPQKIIVVLSDRSVDHGTTDPDATQFFEVYRPQDGTCIWEGL